MSIWGCVPGSRVGKLALVLAAFSPVPAFCTTILFGVTSSNQIIEINPSNGSSTLLNTFTYPGSVTGAAIGIGLAGSDLYVLPGYGGSAQQPLVQINPATGLATGTTIGLGLVAAGQLSLAQGDFVFNSSGTGGYIASANPANGSFSATNGSLDSFSISGTASSTLVISSAAPKFGGLAISSGGTLYALSRAATDGLYTIDSAGNITLVGSTGITNGTVNTFAGLAFDSLGNLYATVGSATSTELYSINKTTGAATALGAVGFGAVDGIVAFGTPDQTQTPEPATIAMTAGGVALLAWMRRRSNAGR